MAQAILPPAKPNPYSAGQPGRELRIAAAEGLQFSTKRLTAKAGERLTLIFENPDAMPHNWALLRPGMLEPIGAILTKEIADPAAAARQYIPQHEAVLAYTDVVAPKSSAKIHFDAPKTPGEYPYVCTFPGHWQIMNGVMTVE
jgi:azurin